MQNDHWRTWLEFPDRHPRVKLTMIGLAILTMVLVLISPWYQICVRDDESLPQYSFFLLRKGVLPQRGDLVAFVMTDEYAQRVRPEGFARPYSRVGRLWVKEVLGVSGDDVFVQGRTIFVRHAPVATVIDQDAFHQPLEPAQFVSPIPSGQYYLGLPHKRSFDSRVIGYVSQHDVQGVLWPLL